MPLKQSLSIKRLLTACLVMALPLAAIGCGSGGKGTVSGEVTLDGKPLPAGSVIFTPANGPAVAGAIKDGKYTASGVPAGDVRVSLDLAQMRMLVGPGGGGGGQARRGGSGSGIPAAGKSTNVKAGGALPQGMPEGAKQDMMAAQQAAATARKAMEEAIPIMKVMPTKYEDPSQSGLTTKVSTGSNTYDLKLTSK